MIPIMEAKTDAHSQQPTRHLEDMSFSVITMYDPVLFASQISTSELLGPAVLRRTTYVLLAASDCDWVLLLSCCLALCPLAPRQAFRFFGRFVVSLSKYRLSSKLSNYRNSFSTIVSYIVSLSNDNNTETFGTILFSLARPDSSSY